MSGGQPQRVDTSIPPRMVETASTSHNTTAPRVVRAIKQIYQRVTQSNTKMSSTMEVDEPPSKEEKQEIQQRRVNQPIPLPPTLRQSKARKINGMWIGSNRKNIKVTSQEKITKLTDAQAERIN